MRAMTPKQKNSSRCHHPLSWMEMKRIPAVARLMGAKEIDNQGDS
jgi:hypothetical protein